MRRKTSEQKVRDRQGPRPKEHQAACSRVENKLKSVVELHAKHFSPDFVLLRVPDQLRTSQPSFPVFSLLVVKMNEMNGIKKPQPSNFMIILVVSNESVVFGVKYFRNFVLFCAHRL